jgi:hypothetical protein
VSLTALSSAAAPDGRRLYAGGRDACSARGVNDSGLECSRQGQSLGIEGAGLETAVQLPPVCLDPSPEPSCQVRLHLELLVATTPCRNGPTDSTAQMPELPYSAITRSRDNGSRLLRDIARYLCRPTHGAILRVAAVVGVEASNALYTALSSVKQARRVQRLVGQPAHDAFY